MTTKRDNRFAAPKKRTRTTKDIAERDQQLRDASNRIHWLEVELMSQAQMLGDIRGGARYIDRVYGLLRGLGLSQDRARTETAFALEVDLIPPDLQTGLDELRKYAHEIGTVGSSQRAMNAVNALCKWGVQGTARRGGPAPKKFDGVFNFDGADVKDFGVVKKNARGLAWLAGSCGPNCALDNGHEDAHLGTCGCTNGCKAWNCPNV